ncbi:hypothetical protein [Nocardioides sp.]|uniref:hypothetical protein n=1 Tax=Nocardioides sp. TaxID=35761 RepID=UPI00198D3B90|nr:hypothetical protein [Nocardioides sp.]MBC7279336.1 hypothetical protein [Nocardioides sp.]
MIGTLGTVGRGLQHLVHPRVWGAVIGAIGGSVFVHANRGELPAAVSTGALVVWAGALAVFVWAVLITSRLFAPLEPLPRSAAWVYFLSVAGMLVGIQLGRFALDAVGRVDVFPGVIVLAVGLHFLPFARAFATPMFTRLGLVMAVLGVAGLVLGLAWTGTATAAAAVVTGVVMLLVISQDAWSDRPGLGRA